MSKPHSQSSQNPPGRSGGAGVLGKRPVPGRPTFWGTVGQGPSALAVGAGGGCLDILSLICPFFPLSPSLWETARYRLKYCLKGPLSPRQPTNQPQNPRPTFEKFPDYVIQTERIHPHLSRTYPYQIGFQSES